MYIYRKKKLLVYRLRDPQRVTAVIPKAKIFQHNGKEFVAVRHGVEETRVLNNLGIEAPSPILFHYTWPGRFKPFQAQREAAAFKTLNSRGFNLSGMGCVDSETEYLSPAGWVRISEYAGGEVAQYHPETGVAEFVSPTEYVKLPCADMIRVKTKYGVDQLLSPEHRMVLRSTDNASRLEIVTAEALLARQEEWIARRSPPTPRGASGISYRRASIPAVFTSVGGSGTAMSDADIRLQVAVIADGHFPGLNNTCVVRLKKERKKLRLRGLLSSAGVAWKERAQDTATARGFTVFTFSAPLRLKEFDTRFWGATPEQLYVIRDEVMHWDGTDRAVSRDSGKGFSFSSFVKASADFVQYAYSGTGMVARLSENRRTRRGKEEIEYVVNVRLNGGTNLGLSGTDSLGNRHRSMTPAKSSDGYKYCFMVPSTFLVLRRNGCVFCTGNTGKTNATLWAYDYLRSEGVVHKMLVLAPLSTLERTWGDAIFEGFPHLNFAVLHGSREIRLKLLNTDADIFLINHDGIKVSGIVEALKDRADIDLIVVDEVSQVARKVGTDRFKALTTIINRQVPRMAWGLTGTPIPNAPTDAWAQCRLLVPGRVSPYFNKFRDTVMRQVSSFVWVPKDNALEVVQEAMQPAVRFSLEECVDLPPCLYQTREVELSPAQAKAYKEMFNKLRTEAEEGEVTAINEAVMAQKLLQIACGVAYGKDQTEVYFDPGPRLKEVQEIIEEAGSKVIVFVPFVSAVGQVADFLRGQRNTVEVIHGGVGKGERDRIFSSFQKMADPKVLVAQPAAMSHGLSLTSASIIVWFAPVGSAETYVQANARVRRPGQSKTQIIIHIEGTPLERKWYQRLQNKEKLQGVFLDMVKDSRVPA